MQNMKGERPDRKIKKQKQRQKYQIKGLVSTSSSIFNFFEEHFESGKTTIVFVLQAQEFVTIPVALKFSHITEEQLSVCTWCVWKCQVQKLIQFVIDLITS